MDLINRLPVTGGTAEWGIALATVVAALSILLPLYLGPGPLTTRVDRIAAGPLTIAGFWQAGLWLSAVAMAVLDRKRRDSVEYIGIKSTRMRSLSGEQIVMSKADLLSSRLRNYGRMAQRRIMFTIGVAYETPADTLERIPALIRRTIERVYYMRSADFERLHGRPAAYQLRDPARARVDGRGVRLPDAEAVAGEGACSRGCGEVLKTGRMGVGLWIAAMAAPP